jgi:hypothetical protein
MPSDQTNAPKDDRAERLAAALRENLKRRKAQARGRRAAEAEPATDTPRSRPDDGEAAGPKPDSPETAD